MLARLESANPQKSEVTDSVAGSESVTEDNTRHREDSQKGGREAALVMTGEEKLQDQLKEFIEFLKWKKTRGQENDLKPPVDPVREEVEMPLPTPSLSLQSPESRQSKPGGKLSIQSSSGFSNLVSTQPKHDIARQMASTQIRTDTKSRVELSMPGSLSGSERLQVGRPREDSVTTRSRIGGERGGAGAAVRKLRKLNFQESSEDWWGLLAGVSRECGFSLTRIEERCAR